MSDDATAEQLANQIDELLQDGKTLKLDALKHETSTNAENFILFTTVETSSLLAQVTERISDICRLSVMQRDALRQKFSIVSQEKLPQLHITENSSSWPENFEKKTKPRTNMSGQQCNRICRRNSDSVAMFARLNTASLTMPTQSESIAATMARAALRGARLTKRPVQVVSPEKKRDVPQDHDANDTVKKTADTQVWKHENEQQNDTAATNTNTAIYPSSADDIVERPFGEAHARISASTSLASTSSFASSSFDATTRQSNGGAAYNATAAANGESMTINGGTTPIHTIPSTSSENGAASGSAKINYILEELLNTEESYVKELESLVEFYVRPFEAIENSTLIPAALRGQSDVIFGNIKDLAEYHRRILLAELRRCGGSVSEICRVLTSQRNNFLALYRPYCQNKPQSEALRGSTEASVGVTPSVDGVGVDQCKFFTECQRRAGHPLPLSAYLLKPIQRITKYQLLLKELSRSCVEVHRRDVDSALTAMLELLGQLNADMQQLHILGFAGDLRAFGPLRLQTECEVYAFKRKSRRLANKPQRRHIFLFDGGVLFCKRRVQPIQYDSEYYEHKLCIPIHNLGFAECSKWSPDRFELWDESRNDGYAVRISDEDEKLRAKWIARLARLTTLYAQQQRCARDEQQQQREIEATAAASTTAAVTFNVISGALHQRRHSSYLSSATGAGGVSNTAQQQWQYQQQQLQILHQQQQQQLLLQRQQNVSGGVNRHSECHYQNTMPHYQRPQSWTSDGSCSVSSQSSVSAFDESVNAPETLGLVDGHGEVPLTAPLTCNSIFATRRRFSSLINAAATPLAHEAAAFPEGENHIAKSPLSNGESTHVTNIHISASKSLQNAFSATDTNGEVHSKHTSSFHQLGAIAETPTRRRNSRLPAAGSPTKITSPTSKSLHLLNNNNNKVELTGN